MAHFYTGQLRLARLCVLRSLMKRPSVLFLRRAAPYKGFALALLRIYPQREKISTGFSFGQKMTERFLPNSAKRIIFLFLYVRHLISKEEQTACAVSSSSANSNIRG